MNASPDTTNQLNIWSVTCTANELEQCKILEQFKALQSHIQKKLNSLCKQFIYQLERVESKADFQYRYKIHLNLRDKLRLKAVQAKFSFIPAIFMTTVTASTEKEKEILKSCQMDQLNRVDGPWSHKAIPIKKMDAANAKPWMREFVAAVQEDENDSPLYWITVGKKMKEKERTKSMEMLNEIINEELHMRVMIILSSSFPRSISMPGQWSIYSVDDADGLVRWIPPKISEERRKVTKRKAPTCQWSENEGGS